METQRPKNIKLSTDGLIVSYGDFVALKCPKLSVFGKCIAIVGHNGAGKSTLMKSILELLPATAGSITLSDHFSKQPFVPERDMAFCPETGAVFADIKVESYIKFWCRIKHGNGSYYKEAGSKKI
jgi:Cu-processing system ATP-binding protein